MDNVLETFWKDFYNDVGKVKERTREVLDLLNDSSRFYI